MTDTPSRLTDSEVAAYLERIDYSGPTDPTVDTLHLLHLAHLVAVPFENLDLVFGDGVAHDRRLAFDKIVNRGRGGWCFENNGAFSLLLEALGFEVMLLGAAVLTDGPTDVIEHLALEVSLDEPHLADVGFGDCFLRPPALNRSGPQNGLDADYEFFPSPKGTTLTKIVDGHPEPQYRFRRVGHGYDEFAPVADRLASDPERSWSSKPFATRALGPSPERVWILRDRLRVRAADGEIAGRDLEDAEWDATLAELFAMTLEREGRPDQPG